ncbi:hypothetical protein [Kerstersia similis]|uniref:hypothetical protein n=1 Tax=Kerstersia similis TaxID=206505 RepID=UPI0039EE0842
MRSLYSRFVLFLIRPALERWAAEKEAAQSMKLRAFMDFQEEMTKRIADLPVRSSLKPSASNSLAEAKAQLGPDHPVILQAEAAQEAAAEALRVSQESCFGSLGRPLGRQSGFVA